MKKPFKERIASSVRIGAGTVAATAVIVSVPRGNALSHGAVLSESMPSESVVISSSALTARVLSGIARTSFEGEPAAVRININTAAEELTSLPGIGEAKAAAIVEYRETHGSFSDISELMNVGGIGDKIFANIRDKITV